MWRHRPQRVAPIRDGEILCRLAGAAQAAHNQPSKNSPLAHYNNYKPTTPPCHHINMGKEVKAKTAQNTLCVNQVISEWPFLITSNLSVTRGLTCGLRAHAMLKLLNNRVVLVGVFPVAGKIKGTEEQVRTVKKNQIICKCIPIYSYYSIIRQY